MIDELEIASLIFINIAFWAVIFLPLISIVDRKKKSLEEVQHSVLRKYRDIRFLIVIYLLLMLGLIFYLTAPTIKDHELANMVMVSFAGTILIIILTFSPGNYDG